MQAGEETVLGVLEEEGFERLPRPLVVAGSTFDFDAAARGTGVSHDLVVVAKLRSEPRRLVRLLSGLSRTLDHAESSRPVSLVLLGDQPDGPTLSDMERYARVLPILKSDPSPDEVRKAVAVLLPLELPSATARGRDPLAAVAALLGRSMTAEHQAFIDASRIGPDEVREELRRFIDRAASGEPNEGAGS
jgi:hypothetical protein